MRAYRAPRWWVEIAILVALDVIYERLRNLAPTRKSVAINRGEKVHQLSEDFHVSFEVPVNHWVAHHDTVATWMNYYYSFLHLPVTATVLIWIFWRHPKIYRPIRSTLVFTTVIALISFYLLPMAPPRLLPSGQFFDISMLHPTFGSWSNPTVAEHSNLYAAMPSLHCAWALWCGLTVFSVATHRVVRYIALLYPLATFTVVIGTANHFAIDGVAGAMVIAISLGAVRALYGHSAYTPARTYEELTLSSDAGPAPRDHQPEAQPTRR
ncbi:phosphatase PAP2 family protein [Calidifontibacter terrae]